jgi:hypothetical protein
MIVYCGDIKKVNKVYLEDNKTEARTDELIEMESGNFPTTTKDFSEFPSVPGPE